MNARHTLPGTLVEHLSQHAEAIDQGHIDPQDLLTHLGQAQLLRVGVAVQHGGSGGDVCDAVEAIAALAKHSMATAFVCWGQRAFIEYLLQSPNQDLAQRLLPDLLAGTQAGATGLSNAMKFLSGVEQLQIEAQDEGEHWRLNGGCIGSQTCTNKAFGWLQRSQELALKHPPLSPLTAACLAYIAPTILI